MFLVFYNILECTLRLIGDSVLFDGHRIPTRFARNAAYITAISYRAFRLIAFVCFIYYALIMRVLLSEQSRCGSARIKTFGFKTTSGLLNCIAGTDLFTELYSAMEKSRLFELPFNYSALARHLGISKLMSRFSGLSGAHHRRGQPVTPRHAS